MIKETTKELNNYDYETNTEVVNLMNEIKQKENLIFKLFQEIETLKEKLDSIQDNGTLDIFDNE
jgi:uncharacterized coiled-coil DUF342 family protein